jgi:hypothetical protein
LSRSRIQKREALAIARKLSATVTGGAHSIASVYHDGVLILTFGIRHGSTSGHGHLVGAQGELKMSESKVYRLASCTMSKDEYFDELKALGIIPARAPK